MNHHTLADLAAINRAMRNHWPMTPGVLRTVESELVATLRSRATIGARWQRAARALGLVRKRIAQVRPPHAKEKP
jgi:hypothetical protein